VTGSRSSLSLTPRRQRRGWLRPLGIVLVVVLVLVGLWAAAIGGLYAYAWVQLAPEDVPVLRDDEVAALGAAGATAPAGATTVLVLVTADRDPTVPREPELVAPPVLVQTGGPREAAATLVLPLELPVAVEGLGERPLAEVQTEGGADLMVRTLMDHTGVRIDHVVSATEEALPRLVEELGPLEVCGTGGCRQTSADEVRADVVTGDAAARVQATADVLRALAAEFDAVRAATAPLEGKRVVDVLRDEVRTDVSLRAGDLLRVADGLSAAATVEVDEIPLIVNPQTEEVVPLLEPAQVRFQHLQEGTPFTGGDVAEEEEDLLRGVQVAVLNGAGVDGLAGRVQLQLEAEGFAVVGTGNAPSFGRDTTTISYPEGDPVVELAAVRLAEALEGAELDRLTREPTFEGEPVDVLVIVGADRDDG
jgi:hypothetical protein